MTARTPWLVLGSRLLVGAGALLAPGCCADHDGQRTCSVRFEAPLAELDSLLDAYGGKDIRKIQKPRDYLDRFRDIRPDRFAPALLCQVTNAFIPDLRVLIETEPKVSGLYSHMRMVSYTGGEIVFDELVPIGSETEVFDLKVVDATCGGGGSIAIALHRRDRLFVTVYFGVCGDAREHDMGGLHVDPIYAEDEEGRFVRPLFGGRMDFYRIGHEPEKLPAAAWTAALAQDGSTAQMRALYVLSGIGSYWSEEEESWAWSEVVRARNEAISERLIEKLKKSECRWVAAMAAAIESEATEREKQ